MLEKLFLAKIESTQKFIYLDYKQSNFMKTKVLVFILFIGIVPIIAQQLSYQKITSDVQKPKEFHMPALVTQTNAGSIQINAVANNKMLCTATDKHSQKHIITLSCANLETQYLTLPEPYEKASSEYVCQFGDKHLISFLVPSLSRKKEPLYGIALVDGDLNIIKMKTNLFHFGIEPLYANSQFAILGNGSKKFSVDADLNVFVEDSMVNPIVYSQYINRYYYAQRKISQNLNRWVVGNKLSVFIYDYYYQIDLNTLEVTHIIKNIPRLTALNASNLTQLNILHNDKVWAIMEHSVLKSHAQFFDYEGRRLHEYDYNGMSDAILAEDGRLYIANVSLDKRSIQVNIFSIAGDKETLDFTNLLSDNATFLSCLKTSEDKLDLFIGTAQKAQVITIDLSNQTYSTIRQFSTNAYVGGECTMLKKEGKDGWYFCSTTSIGKYYYNNTESYNWRNSVFFLSQDYTRLCAWEENYKHLLSPVTYQLINDISISDFALFSYSKPHYWSEKNPPAIYQPSYFLIDKEGKRQDITTNENAEYTQLFRVSESEYLLLHNYAKIFRLGKLTIDN